MAFQHDVLMRLCRERGVTLKSACAAAGLKYGTIHAAVRNERSLSFEAVDSFRLYFGVPAETFSIAVPKIGVEPHERQSKIHDLAARAYNQALRDVQNQIITDGLHFNTDAVLNWLRREGGVLRDFDGLRNYVDLFHLLDPLDRVFRPAKVGPHSLAARYFQVQQADELLNVVMGFERGLIENIAIDHHEAANLQYTIKDVRLDVTVNGVRMRQTYQRILAPVTDIKGRKYLLNFSQLAKPHQDRDRM